MVHKSVSTTAILGAFLPKFDSFTLGMPVYDTMIPMDGTYYASALRVAHRKR
jgi:hypothetical protein